MIQSSEKIIEKINKSMGLGKWESRHDKSRYPFYIVLLVLLLFILVGIVATK